MRLFSLWWRKRAEQDFDDEIDAHLQIALRERLECGEPLEQARRAIRREFGNVGLVKEATRSLFRPIALENIGKDLQYAVRTLKRSPGYTAISILALALGVGANAAVYSVVHSVLLSPLPFPEPGRLVRLWDSYGAPGNFSPVSYPNFRDWRRWSHSFVDMAAYHRTSSTLTGRHDAVHLEGVHCSASFFRVLGAQSLLGRTFREFEELPASADGAEAIVLSHHLWKEQFGGRAEVLGRTLHLDGRPFTVIGVMPPAFNDYTGSSRADFWITTAALARAVPPSNKPLSEERGMSFMSVVARLKPGVSLARAQADMDRAAVTLMRTYPAEAPKEGVIVRDLQDSIFGDVRSILLMLFGATGAVLALTCANLAGLTSARLLARHRELNIRAALGAARWRVTRQLLTETLLLSSIGSCVALGVALAGAKYLRVLLDLPDSDKAPLLAIVAIGAPVTVLVAIIIAVAPALHVWKADLIDGLKQASLTVTESARQRTLQRAFAAAQIAFAAVLLTAGSLFTLGLLRLQKTELGFNPEHALSFPITLAAPKYNDRSRALAFKELADRLRRLPALQFAGAAAQLPLSGGISNTVLDKVGSRVIPSTQLTGIVYAAVSGDYFRALGIKLRAGRLFAPSDTASSVPVVLLNRSAARKYFGSNNPVGETVEPVMWNGAGSTTQPRTVVGIVDDVKLQGIGDEVRPAVYWPFEQVPSSDSLYFAVRSTADSASLYAAIRKELRAIDKDLPIYNVQSMVDAVRGALASPRAIATLVAGFGVLSTLLAAIGIAGVIAFDAARRTREVGIRMTLGASRSDVVRQLTRQAAAIAAIGVGIGVPGSFAVARWLQHSFFGVPLEEPASFAIAAALLLAVIFTAAVIPGIRAVRIDPAKALRYE